jgi:hypothetical protein
MNSRLRLTVLGTGYLGITRGVPGQHTGPVTYLAA